VPTTFDGNDLMLRRLHHAQPESFAFAPANLDWARAQITKYPEGRQASAIIPLLWRAQEQEGWLSRPAIEHVADMLGMAYIRALEVATFYFMFQLQPVGTIAHVQVCGTTSCMICGAEDLIGICQDKIAGQPHALSEDGKFSWEEVECLGACSNAPMVQIGKDYYEDLTAEKFAWILDELAAGRVPTPGPQNGRYASEPQAGLTALMDHEAGRDGLNVSARLATDIGDSVKRIDGTEVPLLAPWGKQSGGDAEDAAPMAEDSTPAAAPAEPEALAKAPAAEAAAAALAEEIEESAPEILSAARDGGADDLKRITGVGPKLEAVLNDMGFYHFDQIAAWGPAEIAWVDARLKFKGRIVRDNWVAQAGELAEG
jgi:NADH-quinone oxidoreductase subunit E